jgi:hypothetical protein
MILLAGYYEDKNAARQAELLECLRLNVENTLLDEIHLFVEEPVGSDELRAARPLLCSRKIRLVERGLRVTYQDMFDYANAHLQNRRTVIANADIFFDHTLARLNGYDLSGKLLCLSRWDVQRDGSFQFFEHPASQDAWVFQAPVPEFPCDFHLGLPACDNRLAWEAARAGLALSNPSRSVRALHLHLSQVRRYRERQRLTGPTMEVPAKFLNAPCSGRDQPCGSTAAVAFRETMGYTLARLETGVSSHNNDTRPFKTIPEPLAGLQFTQVVSSVVSPVEIEFLTHGKLYVLVGNDWYGYYPASAWLRQAGFREELPLVETQRGTGFEVWSLVGDTGESFLLPTQVMLAARQLVRK